MRSDKQKPYTLEVTNQHSVLTISFTTQTEAQQWFIALKQIIGKGMTIINYRYNYFKQGAFAFI